jgi:hypothetical protein
MKPKNKAPGAGHTEGYTSNKTHRYFKPTLLVIVNVLWLWALLGALGAMHGTD